MSRHGATINLRTGARLTHTFGDVEDDAGESILVDPDLLVIRDFSQFTSQTNQAILATGVTKYGKRRELARKQASGVLPSGW